MFEFEGASTEPQQSLNGVRQSDISMEIVSEERGVVVIGKRSVASLFISVDRQSENLGMEEHEIVVLDNVERN